MNKLEYYNRQKEDWNDKELHDIRIEYFISEMTISQIADIHHRTPGSISYKLKNLDLITHNTQSRGYLDYRNSNLYKEIVQTTKSSDAEKKVNKDLKLRAKIEKELKQKAKIEGGITLKTKMESVPVNISFMEMLKMRNEITDLKKDVTEMLRLMNALYEFENQ